MASSRHNPGKGDRTDKITLSGAIKAPFTQAATRVRRIGLLRPVEGDEADRIQFESDRLLIGRDPTSVDGCTVAILADESVSREHAEITRENGEFALRDLNSSNGTYVDGIPVVSCVLRDGDVIQIGRNRFYFDRLYELTEIREGDLA